MIGENEQVWTGWFDSEQPLLGVITAAATWRGLLRVEMGADPQEFRSRLAGQWTDAKGAGAGILGDALHQIREYLSGQRREFDLPLDWSEMASFQSQVLHLAYAIPFGEVRTYGQLADQMGKPGAARAVGLALARNPIPLILPCHRVIGADGKLHGFAAPGGVETKAWLLRLEGSRVL